MIGHSLGAAGAVSVLATALSIRDGMVHPTINYEVPDPDCDLDYIPNEARQLKVRAALVNGFGFGGQNGVLALKAWHE
jgi:3-oxoacyl-[acyl-carrier-protein] synthase II